MPFNLNYFDSCVSLHYSLVINSCGYLNNVVVMYSKLSKH